MPSKVDLASSPARNCWQCQHFGISHDPSLPYQCTQFGIKSRAMPSVVVLQADGRPCMGFLPKASASDAKTGSSAPAVPSRVVGVPTPEAAGVGH